jgi:regulator of replication initiation timing
MSDTSDIMDLALDYMKEIIETLRTENECLQVEIDKLKCSLNSWQESYRDLLDAKMALINENTRLRDTLYKKYDRLAEIVYKHYGEDL